MMHGGFLRRFTNDPKLTSQIMHDYKVANLDPQTRGMLDFAVKLTKKPQSMRASDVEKLRDLGLNEESILAVVLITCTFSFTNRLSSGLGVEVTPDRESAVMEWLESPAKGQHWLIH